MIAVSVEKYLSALSLLRLARTTGLDVLNYGGSSGVIGG